MSEKATHDHLLGSTARWTAGVRARESLREDRLFNDPWAAALAGMEGQEWAGVPWIGTMDDPETFLVTEASASLAIVECTCSDELIWQQRINGRKTLQLPAHHQTDWDVS